MNFKHLIVARFIVAGVASWCFVVHGDDHWAYQAVSRPIVPSHYAWGNNPIDSFVAQRHVENDLRPSKPAKPAKLIRRAYLDLIGIPPRPEAVAAFEANPTHQAYASIIDRLLTSPQYGERWARNWLDMARYADSNGYQADQQRNIWPYRDWVIRAINANMPFDQFSIEQIAGDLIPDATTEQQTATGLHRCTTCNVEAGVDPEENRVNQIIDRVNSTATIWLGSTLECAQCHDHKYDPFTQKDYYQLFAFFNNTPMEVKQVGKSVTFDFWGPELQLPLSAQQKAERNLLQQARKDIHDQLDECRSSLLSSTRSRINDLAKRASEMATWIPLPPTRFTSAGHSDGRTLPDDSLLVSGAHPETDTYVFTASTSVANIQAVRLEALTHEELPGTGPGRHDPERPNFVLTDFSVVASDLAQSRMLTFGSAQADYSAKGYAVTGAIDDDSSSGWAIHQQFNKEHWAKFVLAEPFNVQGNVVSLSIALTQNHGMGRTLGRFRISVLSGSNEVEQLPEDIRTQLSTQFTKQGGEIPTGLMDYFLNQDDQFSKLTKKLASLDKQIDEIQGPTTLTMVEMDERRETSVFRRGNFLDKAEIVKPGVPKVLTMVKSSNSGTSESEEFGDRLAMARWLVSKDNPLVGRVTVNRWWSEFFGQGIVTTLEDFGAQGERPTHPELLDWLASEFVESGWSMKHIHRLITTSSTYCQSSDVMSDSLAKDHSNKWMARGPRYRLAAETIRDNALAISGLLSLKMEGAPVFPPQPDGIWRHVGRNAPKYATSQGLDRFRRGLYVFWRRSAPYPSFTNFDAPDRASCVINRARTNTPLQALTLLNDPAFVEIAKGLTERVLKESPEESVRGRLGFAMRLCVSRAASSEEIDLLQQLYDEQYSELVRDPARVSKLLGLKNPTGDPSQVERAAWFHISYILLNLDETITKG